MTAVRLDLPEEILRLAELPYEGVRDLQGVVIAIEGINVTASVITLATLKQYAPALASAIRRWRLRQDTKPLTLTVRGDGISIKIDLPPNVSTGQLLDQLSPLLERD